MISFRQADLLEKTMKTRLHDVFFYIWFVTTHHVGKIEDQSLVRDHHGRLSAYLEAHFPDKLTKWDDENVELDIEDKIGKAIGQPMSLRILSEPNEDSSHFYDRLRKQFEPKLRQIDPNLEFDSMVSHGMKFHLRMSA